MADDEIGAPEAAVDTSTRGSVERAYEKAFGADAGETPEVQSEEAPEADAGGPARGPDGKFIAKETPEVSAPVDEPVAPTAPAEMPEAAPIAPSEPVGAPSRFSPEAKAAWATTPPAVQAEIGRAFTELERGINEYRARYEPIRAVAERAEAQGQTLADVVATYDGIENMLRANPVQGLDTICRNLGTDLRTVAAHVLGQPAPEVNQQVQQMSQQMREMQGKLAHYEAQERRAYEQRQTETLTTVQEFAASAKAPRFNELTDGIMTNLKNGRAKTLEQAYALAEFDDLIARAQMGDTGAQQQLSARLIPGAGTGATAPTTAAPAAPAQPVAHTPKKAGISVDGAPSGSNPAAPRSKSTREALSRAIAAVGVPI